VEIENRSNGKKVDILSHLPQIAIAALIGLYGFRGAVILYELNIHPNDQSTLNYPEVFDGHTNGVLFYVYYVFGEIVPSAIILYLCIVITWLEVRPPAKNPVTASLSTASLNFTLGIKVLQLPNTH
jgi:hypothetical protein